MAALRVRRDGREEQRQAGQRHERRLQHQQRLDVAAEAVDGGVDQQDGVEVLAEEVVGHEAGREEVTTRRVPDDLVEEAEVVGVALEVAVALQRQAREVDEAAARQDERCQERREYEARSIAGQRLQLEPQPTQAVGGRSPSIRRRHSW